MKLTGNTSEMLRHYVGNRKKGHIFINGRTGKTLRHFEKMIDKWAAEHPEDVSTSCPAAGNTI